MFEQSIQFINICSKILGPNYTFEKLTGGINNPTFLISNDKNKFVLKKINTEATLNFDKYLAERQFFIFLNKLSVINAPKLIDFYDAERILILEYIKPDENSDLEKIDLLKVNEALKFISQINSNNDICNDLVQHRAADSFLALSGHIENINLRLLNFEIDHLPLEHQKNAKELFSLLKNKWNILKDKTYEFLKENPSQNTIDESFLILSPSDFGFHNVITSRGISFFIDFEFSGWDDPAKLYCDIILQPQIPVPEKFYSLIKKEIINEAYSKKYENRIAILYDILSFKWHIIKYSFLNPRKYLNNQFNKINFLKLTSKNYLNEIY